MEKNIVTHPSYRKVVSALNECEERYSGLVKSIDGGKDARFKATIGTLKKEIDLRRNLEVELLTAVESERQRIGQDLHDDLCQRLSAAALLAGSLTKRISALDPKLAGEAAALPQLITESIESCRDLARGLHPLTLAKAGLPAALEELAGRVPFAVKFQWPHSKRMDFEPSVALHLYRIVEEAVGNAVKHSGARSITIELAIVADRPILSVSDDGRGIPADTLKAMGMGLHNMQYRANAIGAHFSVEAARGGGTCVRCTLPARKRKCLA